MEDEKKALAIYKEELRNLEKEAKASKEWNVLFPKLCKIIHKVEQYRPNYGFTGYYYACEEDFLFLLNLCYNVIA